MTDEYALYLKSPEWQERRRACLKAFDYRCQVCGCTSWRRIVDVHHLHYRNVMKELPEDLVPLCSLHHEQIHLLRSYDAKAVAVMRRECEDPHWDDPLPAHVREALLASGTSGPRTCQSCFSEIPAPLVVCEFCGTRYASSNPQEEAPSSWSRISVSFPRK